MSRLRASNEYLAFSGRRIAFDLTQGPISIHSGSVLSLEPQFPAYFSTQVSTPSFLLEVQFIFMAPTLNHPPTVNFLDDHTQRPINVDASIYYGGGEVHSRSRTYSQVVLAIAFKLSWS